MLLFVLSWGLMLIIYTIYGLMNFFYVGLFLILFGIIAVVISMQVFIIRSNLAKEKVLRQNLEDIKLLSEKNLRQEREKQEILQNQKAQLEREVSERTLELQEANEELAQYNEELHQKSEEITAQRDSLEEALQKLKAAQAQLIQSEKMSSLGQLTAGIAHEINNPVNFISANIDSLKENIGDILVVLKEYDSLNHTNYEEKLEEIQQLKENHQFDLAIAELEQLIQGIQEGTNRTTQIIQGLRTFSRLDEDVLKLTNIHENLDATLTLLQNRYKDRVEIIKDYGEIPPLEAYPGKLNQVFMNLLANAIEAIEGEGRIWIKTQTLGDQVLISIQDTGSGIPPEVRERIFEPFFTTKDVGKGVGLGLSIVHSIIEKHQGEIEVESEVGEGTTFKIILPRPQKSLPSS